MHRRESSFLSQAKDSESGGLDVLPIRLCGRAEPPGDLPGFLAPSSFLLRPPHNSRKYVWTVERRERWKAGQH